MSNDEREPKIENLPVRDDGFGNNDIDNDRLLQGQRIVCIDGEWSGPDGTKVPADKRYLVLGTAEGIQFWQDGQLVKEWVKKPNMPLPEDLDALNATIPKENWEEGINGPRAPYVHVWCVYLLDQADGSIWTHINSTNGAAIATRELRSKVRWKRGLLGGRAVLPIVTLGKRMVSMQYKKWGPDFVPVDWHDPNPDLPATSQQQSIEDRTEAALNDSVEDVGRPAGESIEEILDDKIPEEEWAKKAASTPEHKPAATAAQKPHMTKRGVQKIARGRGR